MSSSECQYNNFDIYQIILKDHTHLRTLLKMGYSPANSGCGLENPQSPLVPMNPKPLLLVAPVKQEHNPVVRSHLPRPLHSKFSLEPFVASIIAEAHCSCHLY